MQLWIEPALIWSPAARVQAIHLAELIERDHPGAREVLRQAHENLLACSTNFWESAWLERQIASHS
ncbi:hypothetical protein MPSD_54260 [Mycobacterium pseudoshottsii JCM 15466]|nr:hypothetical protein MPSD_54260 [Mycobacterium pseudoshottsii JCM 15466]